MFTYPAYKALKQQLNTIAPVFYFLGQYQKGKDNTSYVVPAIYIEMPKNAIVTYWGRGVKGIRPANINIHYISNAPYKNHDSDVQDSFLAQHDAALSQIDTVMRKLILKKADDSLMSERFLQIGSNEYNFIPQRVFSILNYSTELYL